MTYLDEAYRRFKLPISVIPFIGLNGGVVFAIKTKADPTQFYHYPDEVKSAYLAAVKELSQ